MSQEQINVDHAEVSKFEELAARWWDPHSEFKPLHEINPLRLDYIDRLAPLAGKKVLDVGCGGGILSESMAAKGGRVMGIDMGEAPLQVARLHLLESGLEINYERIPVERLADEYPEHYDIVTCMEMLEHVPDPASVVNACARLVKPGGRLFFSTINRNPKAYLFASHRSVEAGHRFMHEHLGVEPLLDLRFRLGEGTGAAVAMELLDAATRVLCDIKTFEEVAIVDAQREG